MANANTHQIHVTNCTTKLHSQVHEARKIWCNHFQRALQEHVNEWSFYTREALPLVKTRFLRLAENCAESRETVTRWPRNIRQDIRRNIRATSRQWPGSGNRNAVGWPGG
jgi:hypothetical protein